MTKVEGKTSESQRPPPLPAAARKPRSSPPPPSITPRPPADFVVAVMSSVEPVLVETTITPRPRLPSYPRGRRAADEDSRTEIMLRADLPFGGGVERRSRPSLTPPPSNKEPTGKTDRPVAAEITQPTRAMQRAATLGWLGMLVLLSALSATLGWLARDRLGPVRSHEPPRAAAPRPAEPLAIATVASSPTIVTAPAGAAPATSASVALPAPPLSASAAASVAAPSGPRPLAKPRPVGPKRVGH